MYANIFFKTIGDRWKGWTIAVASLLAMFLFGMAVYRDIDLTIYQQLPEAYLSLLGLAENIDVGGLAIGAILGFYGAITLAAMAISMGSASIAGEERDGTMGLLLGNPKSRTTVLESKVAAMVLLITISAIVIWLSVYPIASVLGVEIGGLDVTALMLHMFAVVLFHGFLAAAIGAWTGSKGAASGITAGVLVISFFAVGFLPLIEGYEDVAKVFPWYYFNSTNPVFNGIDLGHVGALFVGVAVFALAALIGLNRRDLKSQSVATTLLDRLRANPFTQKAIEKLAGSARVSSIWLKTATEHQGLFIIVALLMFAMMGVMMGPMYGALPPEALNAFKDFPEQLLALFGGGDLSTPEGWYQIETFGMMAPVAVMIVAISIGARALAGEEARRTMGLLLANPVSRSRVVLEKTFTMVVFSIAIGIATFAGVAIGSVIASLDMSTGNIAATSLLATLVGLVFGSFALLLSAATGRGRIAIFGAVGAGLVFHVLNSLATINSDLEGVAQISPFFYYLNTDPLMTGMDWVNGAILLGVSVVLIVLSVVLFQRRDLRQSG